MAVTILVLVIIGLVLGVFIYIANLVIPQKVKGLGKIDEISSLLPGANCGACGNPSCYGYARLLSGDPEYISKNPCSQILGDNEVLQKLEEVLGIDIDSADIARKAVVRCNGKSELIYDYSGLTTCKGAAQLLRGYKKCAYACLGLGDCVAVCPHAAISINMEKGIAVIDRVKCIGCGLCVVECPQNMIDLIPPQTKVVLLCNYQTLRDITGREKCESGCIHCRKCLNACEHDAITFNTERGIPEFDNEKCTLCRKCIEVCPSSCLAEFSEVTASLKSAV
jgi:Na+-translocating ferredoxin:NAD+ oxidoreductase RNF subunit RnfB